MVCLGNICRSPLAESILRSKVDSEKVEVDSAGTSNYHVGDLPDERAINTGKRYDLDLSQLRGRQFEVADFDRFDYIYVMDGANYEDVIALARNEKDKEKVSLILDKIHPGESMDVPDPYFGVGNEDFPKVYELLDEACAQIAREVS
jgi:protein-tyrosine phosphatase